jgi:uncharacterized membrane protein
VTPRWRAGHGVLAAILLACCVAWAAAIVAAPVLAAQAPPRSAGLAAAAVTYLAGGAVCHQRIDRSFSTAGVPWPVCGRCAGLYLSAAIAVLVLGPAAWAGAVSRPGDRVLKWLVALAAMPLAIAWSLEQAGLLAADTMTRAATAAPLGCAIGGLLMLLGSSGAAGPENLR